METKQKRIQELEEELNKELSEFAGTYQVFAEQTQGDKRIKGKHISVYFPAKVKVNTKEVVELFEKYYGDIKSSDKMCRFTNAGYTPSKEMQELVLNLED